MKVRTWLARNLAPVIFKEAERYRRMRYQIDNERWWLAHDFPEIAAFSERILSMDHNHWRTMEDRYRDSEWEPEINQFREQLRRKFLASHSKEGEQG